jgi:uncharacterized C2H2 Zn-finger protein
MKCKKCGKSFRDIKAIGAHYRKSHPSAMKSRKPRKTSRNSLRATMRRIRDQGYTEREVMNAFYGD